MVDAARRVMLWGIPAVLVAALIWSFVPHEAAPPAGPASGGRAAPAGSQRPGSGGVPASGPSRAHSPTPGDTTPEHRPGVSSGEIRFGDLLSTDDHGEPRWKIVADDMALGEGGHVVILKRVRATFFDHDGSTMAVTGDTGEYDTLTEEVRMSGAVHGVSANGRELYADALHYDPPTRMVEGTGHIRVVQERVIMYADRMLSDLRLGQTKFFGNIHMTAR